MVNSLIYILISVIIISLISLVGIVLILPKKRNTYLTILVAFAAGSMLATAFFDLIPESFKLLENFNFVLIGIIAFYILEMLIHWHHNHEEECEKCIHPVVYLNLIGDGFHNFLDGVIIAASFLLNIQAGIAVSIAIALHEIPQELGDFGVLVSGGLSKAKALLFNFLSATSAIFGALISYLFLNKIQFLTPYILALAAGGFIYIAGSDLFPELHKERGYKKSIIQLLFLILGILLIALTLILFPE
jgi:zinc and cadmium transporter